MGVCAWGGRWLRVRSVRGRRRRRRSGSAWGPWCEAMWCRRLGWFCRGCELLFLPWWRRRTWWLRCWSFALSSPLTGPGSARPRSRVYHLLYLACWCGPSARGESTGLSVADPFEVIAKAISFWRSWASQLSGCLANLALLNPVEQRLLKL